MSIFSKTKEKEDLIFIFDIRSSGIGGAAFLMSKNKAPKIIFSIKEQIPIENVLDFKKFLSATTKVLDSVANKLSIKRLGSPKKIFCVLSSPWYFSQTRTILYKKESPFYLNNKLADSLIQKEVLLFEEEYFKKYKNLDNKLKLLEFKNMRILLNGYPTSEPLGKKTKDLEMTIYLSVAEEKVLNKFKQAVERHFNSKNLKFISFGKASFGVSRDVFVHEDSFLLVDVGGEITDILMIKKDVLRSSISFPFGKNSLIRSIKEKLNCSVDEAKSYFYLYKDQHLSGILNEKLNIIISELKNEWMKKFQESLASITNDISIPSIVFVTADEDLADFFIEIIKKEQFNQYSLTDSKFRVIFLGNQALHGIVLFGDNVLRDPFLILETIYINRFFH